MANEEPVIAEAAEKDRFVEHLRSASETVRSWPEWKQTMFGRIVIQIVPTNGSIVHNARVSDSRVDFVE